MSTGSSLKINVKTITPIASSKNGEHDTFGDNDNNVIVTWWERNATSNEPVVRISTDKGATFRPILKLAANQLMEPSVVVEEDKQQHLFFFY